MSRGPGKWQRAILGEVQEKEIVVLRDLLPTPHTHSDYSALMRAANRLRRDGRIALESMGRHVDWKHRNHTTARKLDPGESPQLWFSEREQV